MSIRPLSVLVAVTALALAVPTTRADLIVDLTPIETTLAQGGPDVLEATIRADGATPPLDFFLAVFRIVPVGGATPGGLRFADPPLAPPTSDPGYVFFGSSGLPTVAVTSDPAPSGLDNILTVTDSSTEAAGVPVPMTGSLLARFEVEVGPGARAGDRFEVVFDPGQSTFLTADLESIGVSAGPPSVVTIIPEPSSLAMAAVGLAATAIAMRKSSRVRLEG